MNTSYLDMIAGKPVKYTPVWFMRQAGRSQAEYRKIKEKYGLFEITHQPELCAYITKLPVDQYNVDAAIIYKDIMTPLKGIGVPVEIKAGVGPIIENVIEREQDIDRLGELNMERDLPYIIQTIQILTKEQLQVPLIGFCGAPFTLASYLIEGGPSKNYNRTKGLMIEKPELWHKLMAKLTKMNSAYLQGQIQAGVQAIQIFDSWSGALNKAQYLEHIFPYMRQLILNVKDAYPTIPITMQAVGASHLLSIWKELPSDVLSLDWRITLEEAHSIGIKQTLQGNLDPAYLQADWPIIEAEVIRILEEGKRHGKHIFNLGHGVLPNTNPMVLKRLTEFVHTYTKEA